MTRRIEHIAFFLIVAACVLVALWCVRWWRTRGRGALCPGPRRPWSEWLFPWKWLMAGRCGYDLRGTPPDARGVITCSECGQRHRSLRSAWTTPRRVRLGATAAALLLVAAAGYSVRPIRKGAWAKSTPTDGLLLVQSTFGQWTTRHVRSELDTRIDSMSIRQRRWLAGVAVHALGDDYEPWNAVWAMGALSELGPDAEPAILGGLSSGDWQQRQLCAEVSRRKFEAARSGVGPLEYRSPSPRLIEVSVEALADDALPYGTARRVTGRSTATTWVLNARSSLAFLAACGQDAEPFLRPALRSPDPQQLFLAACSAGLARCDGLASEAIPLLIPHLKSDERTGNAKLAAAALFAFGEHARPSVEHLTSGGADAQQRRIARRILAEWEGPARDAAEAAARDAIYAEWSDEPFTAVRRGGVPGFHPFLE